jgi:hypothetical protein
MSGCSTTDELRAKIDQAISDSGMSSDDICHMFDAEVEPHDYNVINNDDVDRHGDTQSERSGAQ